MSRIFGENLKKNHMMLFELLPFFEFCTLQFCKCDISESIIGHTCDTFLNPNREIWNFWSGNLCLVSGGFHVANFGTFLPKLKSRNLVTFLEICYRASQCQHMPTEVRLCVRLQFKKPPLILF